jgi:peptidoglycan/LPS O-acetylase OafA/YrhL
MELIDWIKILTAILSAIAAAITAWRLLSRPRRKLKTDLEIYKLARDCGINHELLEDKIKRQLNDIYLTKEKEDKRIQSNMGYLFVIMGVLSAVLCVYFIFQGFKGDSILYAFWAGIGCFMLIRLGVGMDED